jgi:hypothetical protein
VDQQIKHDQEQAKEPGLAYQIWMTILSGMGDAILKMASLVTLVGGKVLDYVIDGYVLGFGEKIQGTYGNSITTLGELMR